MLTDQTQDLVKRLRAGETVAEVETQFVEQVGVEELLAELSRTYPVRFQERSLKGKREFGMASKVSFLLNANISSGRLLPSARFKAILKDCLFVSCYGDSISEITAVDRIRLVPVRKPLRGLSFKTGCGQKLDKTVDGWVQKAIEPKVVQLSEELLVSRGWNFNLASVVATRSHN